MTDKEFQELILNLKNILDEVYKIDSMWKKRGSWQKEEKGSILYPPASEVDIQKFEDSHKRKIPPSYRRFLKFYNGWKHFWLDFTLLGVNGEHTQRAIAEIKDNEEWLVDRLKRNIGELTPNKIKLWEKEDKSNIFLPNHFTVGTSFSGEMYIFDANSKKKDSDMEIVFWNIAYGAHDNQRYKNFEEMLKRISIDAEKYLMTKKREKSC